MDKRTELNELGEFGLIEHLNPKTKPLNSSTLMGVGDDAAILSYKEKVVLVSTDAMIEGVHFDLTYTPLKHLGYKACVVNFSDIYAMNGTPKQITIALGASNRYSVEALDELYEGIHLACEHYGVDIVGGDTVSSPSGLFLSITVIGEGDKDTVVKRSTAKEKDLLCVTGDLGAAYAGLLILQREKVTFNANPNYQPDLSKYPYVVQRQLKPNAQKKTIEWLKAQSIVPTSMIDISDGLASEALHICKESNCGCEIYLEKIPMDREMSAVAHELELLPDTMALNGGEDYELLFTIDQKDYEKVKDNEDIHIIGFITDKSQGAKLITPQNTTIDLKAQGFNHFTSTESSLEQSGE